MFLLRSTIVSALLSSASAKPTCTVGEACPAAGLDDNALFQFKDLPVTRRSNSESLSKLETKDADLDTRARGAHSQHVDADSSPQSAQNAARSSVVAMSSERMNGGDDHQGGSGFHRSRSASSGAAALNKRDVEVLENILTEANLIEEGDGTEEEYSGTGAGHSLQDLEEVDQSADAVQRVILGPHNADILNAIEEVAREETPEDAVGKGLLVTSKILDEVNGLAKSPPEQAKQNMQTTEEGDMLMELGVKPVDTTETSLLQGISSGRRYVSNLWQNPSSIPYCFSPTIASSSKRAFQDAVQHYHNNVPCVHFRQVDPHQVGLKCAEEPAIFVKSNEQGCFANLGEPPCYRGSCHPSVVNLQSNACDSLGYATHELGHALGMLHEHSRTDHDAHVQILWDNIEQNRASEFLTNADADIIEPYDIMSIMHYSDTAFGIWGEQGPMQTIQPLQNVPGKVMGQRMGLSMTDVNQVTSMYGCQASESFVLCTPDPDSCTTEACVCHQDDSSDQEWMKVQDVQGCSRCVPRCADPPGGTLGACACPAGYAERGFFDVLSLLWHRQCYALEPAVRASSQVVAQEVQADNGKACLENWTYRGATCSTSCCGWHEQGSQPGRTWCYTSSWGHWDWCTVS